MPQGTPKELLKEEQKILQKQRKRIGLLTNAIKMGDLDIPWRSLGHMFSKSMFRPEDAQRDDSHHHPVGLTFLIGTNP